MKAGVQRKIKNDLLRGSFLKDDILTLISIVCRDAERIFRITEDYNLLRITAYRNGRERVMDIREFVLYHETDKDEEIAVSYLKESTEIGMGFLREEDPVLSIKSEQFNAIELMTAMEVFLSDIQQEFVTEKEYAFVLPKEEEELPPVEEEIPAVSGTEGRKISRREEIRKRRIEEEKRKKKKMLTYIGIGAAALIAVAALVYFFFIRRG